MSTTELNIALFQLISSSINEQHRARQSERREFERHPYRCLQSIAAFDGEHVPDQQSFRTVMCHDLSAGGFSFFTSSIPDSTQLVIALGAEPHIKLFVAEVVRVYPTDRKEGDEYRVGCRFIRRLGSE